MGHVGARRVFLNFGTFSVFFYIDMYDSLWFTVSWNHVGFSNFFTGFPARRRELDYEKFEFVQRWGRREGRFGSCHVLRVPGAINEDGNLTKKREENEENGETFFFRGEIWRKDGLFRPFLSFLFFFCFFLELRAVLFSLKPGSAPSLGHLASWSFALCIYFLVGEQQVMIAFHKWAWEMWCMAPGYVGFMPLWCGMWCW